jgi:anaerobic ribonucleoside-triphosphate reductase activating protein
VLLAKNDAHKLLDNIDLLVDGKFEQENKSLRLKFRGSTNQRIIDVNKSRLQNRVVLSELVDQKTT